MKRGNKKFAAALEQIPEKSLQLQEAIPLVQKVRYAKFDETIEIAMRLGVDPNMLIKWYAVPLFCHMA